MRAAALLAGLAAAAAAPSPSPSPRPPQNCASIPADAFTPRTLTNGRIQLSVLPYGGTVQRLIIPAPDGVPRDVALGYDDATRYCADPGHPYFGALIGRVANRIAWCNFTLDGTQYRTPCNEGHAQPDGSYVYDTLHGGRTGFDRAVWAVEQPDAATLQLSLTSPDGDQGFPSELSVNVTYRLLPATSPTDQGAWDITYSAVNTGTKPTVASLTNHIYLHLGGFYGPATVLGHVLAMPNASRYQAIDANLLPTGVLGDVTDAPWMDFRTPGTLGQRLSANGTLPAGAIPANGIDNAFVFAGYTGAFVPQLSLTAPESRLQLTLWTDQPGVQVYSGNMLPQAPNSTAIPRKSDQNPTGGPAFYPQHGAFALEAQQYIGAAQFPAFPSIALAPGQVYTQHTAYAFAWV